MTSDTGLKPPDLYHQSQTEVLQALCPYSEWDMPTNPIYAVNPKLQRTVKFHCFIKLLLTKSSSATDRHPRQCMMHHLQTTSGKSAAFHGTLSTWAPGCPPWIEGKIRLTVNLHESCHSSTCSWTPLFWSPTGHEMKFEIGRNAAWPWNSRDFKLTEFEIVRFNCIWIWQDHNCARPASVIADEANLRLGDNPLDFSPTICVSFKNKFVTCLHLTMEMWLFHLKNVSTSKIGMTWLTVSNLQYPRYRCRCLTWQLGHSTHGRLECEAGKILWTHSKYFIFCFLVSVGVKLFSKGLESQFAWKSCNEIIQVGQILWKQCTEKKLKQWQPNLQSWPKLLGWSALPPQFNVEILSHWSGEVTQLCVGGGEGGGIISSSYTLVT